MIKKRNWLCKCEKQHNGSETECYICKDKRDKPDIYSIIFNNKVNMIESGGDL